VGDENFNYQAHKNGVLRIFWEGRCVMTLGGSRGQKVINELEAVEFEEDVQALLQRVTGNFKRGNERRGRQR